MKAFNEGFNGTHDTLEHTRAYMKVTQDTQTHTHAGRPEVAVNLFSAFFPSRIVLPPGQLLSARGPSEVNRPSWSGIDRRVCCWGSCGHWENMQTPHRDT